MNCPNCKNAYLQAQEIEDNLPAQVCDNCDGKWISHENYESWLKFHGEILPEIPAGEESGMTIPHFQLARLCPKCKRILIKYKVGHNIPFQIDRCGDCAGVWLDQNEWETLKSRNLHDELNKIFTDHWQEQVSREETRRKLETIYQEKFGADDYRQIRDFKSWIDTHDKRSEILAYLDDPNPLQF